jgi:hypothetical protein
MKENYDTSVSRNMPSSFTVLVKKMGIILKPLSHGMWNHVNDDLTTALSKAIQPSCAHVNPPSKQPFPKLK